MREYVETWKCIAAKIGRSERWCRYMAFRTEHPLPVCAFGGFVRLYLDEYEAWERAECERGRVAFAQGTPKVPERHPSDRVQRRATGSKHELHVPLGVEWWVRQRANERGVSRRFVADELINAMLDAAEQRPLTALEVEEARRRASPGRPRVAEPEYDVINVAIEMHGAIAGVARRAGRSIKDVASEAINAALDAAGAPR